MPRGSPTPSDKSATIVIAPYDMCNGRERSLERIGIPWYTALCDDIEKELRQ